MHTHKDILHINWQTYILKTSFNSQIYKQKLYKRMNNGLCSVLRPRKHSIGYMGDGFYR